LRRGEARRPAIHPHRARIPDGPAGASALYLVLTRSTRTLALVAGAAAGRAAL